MAAFRVSSSGEALVDTLLHVKIEGLDPCQNVTVYASVRGERDDVFDSYALYQSDESGVVDMKEHSSLGGFYLGTEPMGLFWSMKPSPRNKRPRGRLLVRNVEVPIEVEMAVYGLHLSCYDEIENCSPLARTTIKRWYKSQNVTRVPVREGRLRGTLFIPKGPGPFPGVVDLFGSAGGLMEFRASLLASHGFLTLALAYFDFEDLPDIALGIELEYFEEARDLLLKHPSAAKTGVGIVGISVGGTLALAVVTYVPGYTCAVLINAPVFAQYLSLHYKDRVWPAASHNTNRAYVDKNTMILKHILDDHWEHDLGDSLIEFHKSEKSFLFIFSEDDKAINTPETVRFAKRQLENGTCQYKIIVYEGAGHLLEPPYSPHSTATYAKRISLPQAWGGHTKQHANAQLCAWQETLEYLRNTLEVTASKL